MADANRASERTSHPKGLPHAGTDDPDALPNEARVIAGPGGLERTDGGYVQGAEAAYDPARDAGRRTSGKEAHDRDEKPNRQNDAGEMADSAG